MKRWYAANSSSILTMFFVVGIGLVSLLGAGLSVRPTLRAPMTATNVIDRGGGWSEFDLSVAGESVPRHYLMRVTDHTAVLVEIRPK